ncbi:hypothetical protein pb186bvf_006429 [Paramecium bursaria]
MILSLGYIKDFLRDNKIPIDFDIHRVASQSQSDILKLLSDIRQHLGHKQDQENPQKQKLNNLVKQAENGKNIQPSPIRQRERQQLSGIWYPPSEHKSNHRQRSTSIGGGSRLSLHQQFSSKKNQEYQSSSICKSPILVEQEVIAKQDSQAQNYVQQNQQVNPNSQQQVDNRDRDRDIIQQQIQQAANQQQEIYKFVRQIEELMAKSANVLEFKRQVYNEVKNAIERYEYHHIPPCAQPQDDGLIMAGSLLRAYLGQNMSNIQILPSFSQWPLWQQLTERSIQRTNDAQTQCHLPSRAQSNFQTPNKSHLSVSQVDHARRSVQQSPHQSVTKNNTVIGNLSPIPYDQQSSSLQQPFDQSIQQPSLSFHTITDLSSMPQVQAIQQINESSQNSLHSIQLNGLQQNGLQQNIQQQTPQLYKYQNGSLSEQAGIYLQLTLSQFWHGWYGFVSAPTQMNQFQTQQANQFVLNTPQQGNSQIVYQENAQQQQQFQELQQQYIQQTPVTHKLSMYPNHTNESNRSIFQNTGYQHYNFPQQENYSTPQQLQVFPQIQTQSSQQRTSIFQNLFQSPFQQTPQFNEQQAQNQNMNQQDDRSSAVNGERTQLIENVPPYQRNQMDQNEQQNTNDPSNPLMIQPGQTYNESQSSRGSQYNFQNK